MSGMYPDSHEAPETYLRRLRSKFNRGAVRPEDRWIYESGIAWAKAQMRQTLDAAAASKNADGVTNKCSQDG